jgi:hypothetical protein
MEMSGYLYAQPSKPVEITSDTRWIEAEWGFRSVMDMVKRKFIKSIPEIEHQLSSWYPLSELL